MPSFCAICAVWRLFCIRLHRYSPFSFPPFLRAVQRPSGCYAAIPDIHMISVHSLFAAQKPQNAQNKTPYQRHAETVKRRRNAYKRPKTLYHADFQTDNTHRRREAALPGPDTATNVEPRGISMDTSSRPAPIRIAAIRPKVAKVADSRKVDSRRIVGKSPESR